MVNRFPLLEALQLGDVGVQASSEYKSVWLTWKQLALRVSWTLSREASESQVYLLRSAGSQLQKAILTRERGKED